MTIRGFSLVAMTCVLLAGCGGGGGGNNTTTPTTPTPVANPAPPTLGAQMDRVGRAAIATALISPLADAATRGMNRDAYNVALQADWDAFSANLQANLAVYDSLDTVCGNQVLADPSLNTPARYDTLTGALIDDRIYLRASSGACSQYLGVELDATGLVPNQDCGGRTPLYDTIDVSYTALSNDLSIAVGDGVAEDNVAQGMEIFPFLAAFVADPLPPTLGAQVDRVGRAAIATALISPLADPGPRGVQRDAYNAALQPDWANFAANIQGNLAIYDGLDTNCGNQVLADATLNTPARYATLTDALVDDRVYLNSRSGSCSQYLGVELNATGLVANTDCGGRTPLYDTIDVSYTALSNDLSVAVGDGVPVDNALQSAATFPFLATP